jgi:hypothetical protein
MNIKTLPSNATLKLNQSVAQLFLTTPKAMLEANCSPAR